MQGINSWVSENPDVYLFQLHLSSRGSGTQPALETKILPMDGGLYISSPCWAELHSEAGRAAARRLMANSARYLVRSVVNYGSYEGHWMILSCQSLVSPQPRTILLELADAIVNTEDQGMLRVSVRLVASRRSCLHRSRSEGRLIYHSYSPCWVEIDDETRTSLRRWGARLLEPLTPPSYIDLWRPEPIFDPVAGAVEALPRAPGGPADLAHAHILSGDRVAQNIDFF